MAVRKIFWRNKVMIDYEDVGGNLNRTVKLNIKNGEAWLKVSGQGYKRI
jgi:chemotaxis protein CheD